MKHLLFVAVVIIVSAFQPLDDPNTLRDPRDGKVYKTVTIGKQVWMAENLRFDATGTRCYENTATNCDRYGKLYDYATALKSCPEGWHLPSKAEWETLVANYPSGEDAYKNLIEGGASSFNATLHGVYTLDNNQFITMKEHGAYWTATDFNNDRAWAQRFLLNTTETYQSQAVKLNGQACRCVKN